MSDILGTLRSALYPFSNERGQLASSVDAGTTDGGDLGDPGTDTTGTSDGSTPAGDEGAGSLTQDTFFDPKQLAPELQVQWKKMQGAYTKRMQQAAGWRQQAEVVDRFNTDPAFRKQTLQQYAHELGNQTGGSPQSGSPAGAPPAEFVQAFKDSLPPELQFMAEANAKAFWQANQLAMKPLMEGMQSRDLESRTQTYEQLAGELSEEAPGWEQHEDEMADLLNFLGSPTMRHPVYGSKLKLLHRLVTGEAGAVRQAITRMGNASQNRVSSGRSGRNVQDNIQDRIMKAPNLRGAFQIAGQAAMEKLGIQEPSGHL